MQSRENVLLDILSMKDGDEADKIAYTVAGTLEQDDGRYILKYIDDQTDSDGCHTEITVDDGAVSMIRTGGIGADMFFKKNTPFSTVYTTPFGNIDLNILPTLVITELSSESGRIELEYIINICGTQMVNRLQLSYKRDDSEAYAKGDTFYEN